MAFTAEQLVAGLASGKGLAEIAAGAGVSTQEAAEVWREYASSKLPPAEATLQAGVDGQVEVIRDKNGVPHIYAGSERDLYCGLGFAMAQDKLWMMDYMRRKATGRLSEILGPDYLQQDIMFRMLGFHMVCTRNYYLMGNRWRQVVDSMADGINLAIDQAGDNLPVEFDILDYSPDRWTPIDILVGLRYLWWGLSGRLFQITGSTILERELGARVEEFVQVERPDLYIVPDGAHKGRPGEPRPVRDTLNLTDDPHGSNNWVIAGSRTRSGKPLMANDPHYTYEHGHGHFYEAHLHGGGHTEAGFSFIGTPGMMSGMNDRIAWGYTNSGTSIRDLYAEELHPDDPSLYKKGDKWAPVTERAVTIKVKGAAPVRKTIRYTAHGPIVNDVIPKVSDNDPPLSLRWVGFEMIEDVQALLEMNTARNWQEWRAALRNWSCSVTNFSYGDVEGHIGYQLSARVPLRNISTRGVRPAWHPDHEWQGYIPFDSMPRMEDPADGIVASANNRTINPNSGVPIYGAFAGGTRAARIRQVLEGQKEHDADDFCRMLFDSKALIAEEVTPRIIAALRQSADSRLAEVTTLLAAWDFRFEIDQLQPAIYEAFMKAWTGAYAAAVLPDQPDVRAAAGPATRRALAGEESLLPGPQLDQLIISTMASALAQLTDRFGPDLSGWTWGAVHQISYPHPLGHIARMGELLNGPGFACAGTNNTINNVTGSPLRPFAAASGPTYRMVADLSDTGKVLINHVYPTSGHPASPHYVDSTRDWASGAFHVLHRERARIEAESEGVTRLVPGVAPGAHRTTRGFAPRRSVPDPG